MKADTQTEGSEEVFHSVCLCIRVFVLSTCHKKPTVLFHRICWAGLDLRLEATEILYSMQSERAADLHLHTLVASSSCCLSDTFTRS